MSIASTGAMSAQNANTPPQSPKRPSASRLPAPPTLRRARQSSRDAPQFAKAKRKVDWEKIEQKGTFKGFTVKPVKLPRIKKRRLDGSSEANKHDDLSAEGTQQNPFDDTDFARMDYSIKPVAEWESLNRYRAFNIQGLNIGANEYIYVKPDEMDKGDPNAAVQDWVARVLEVRAADSTHVYLRIYWMYRPEDLPKGRQPHHGKNELIASNRMDIIEALTVENKVDVRRWEEQDDQGEVLDPAQLFWRQTFDFVKNKFSALPKHCKDEQPCNPDELLVQCDSCGKWLHGSCLEEDAVRTAYKTHNVPHPDDAEIPETHHGQITTPATSKYGRRRSSGVNPANPTPKRKQPVSRKASKKNLKRDFGPKFTAEASTSPSGRLQMVVTDRRPGKENNKWDVPAKCLLCGELIDAPMQAAIVEEAGEEIVVMKLDAQDESTKDKNAEDQDTSDVDAGDEGISTAQIKVEEDPVTQQRSPSTAKVEEDPVTQQHLPSTAKDEDIDSVVGDDNEEIVSYTPTSEDTNQEPVQLTNGTAAASPSKHRHC